MSGTFGWSNKTKNRRSLLMFNRTYHIRARRQGLGRMLADGLLRPHPDSGYYRPQEPISPRSGAEPPPRRRKRNSGPDRGQGSGMAGQLRLPFPATEADLAEEFDRLFPEKGS